METSSSSNLRARVVAEALSWQGTKFCHAQCVKGVGVDCAMSLIAWFSSCGVIEFFDPGPYSRTWFLHQREEKFLNIIERYAVRLPDDETPLPADIALYKHGLCVSHGALVVDDTFVVHACAIARKVERRERSAMTYALAGYWRVHAFCE